MVDKRDPKITLTKARTAAVDHNPDRPQSTNTRAGGRRRLPLLGRLAQPMVLVPIAFAAAASSPSLASDNLFLEPSSPWTDAPSMAPWSLNRLAGWGLVGDAVKLSVFHPLGAPVAALEQKMLAGFCDTLTRHFRKLGWRENPCDGLKWHYSMRSEKGFPLIYADVFDEDAARNAGPASLQTTMILSGVHPDEITPVHLAFAFARRVHERPEIVRNARVVIAPLVNPDGFFAVPRTRTNVNGVDLNRNFATADWWKRAGTMWQERRKRDPRHFPGQAPDTEQGTRFQAQLIADFEPDKILTIHAPLGFLDYDGPGDTTKVKSMGPHDLKSVQLANLISKSARNFRIIDYTYFPGSLGNFAGHDRRIPTITVELDTMDPRQSLAIRDRFFPGLTAAIGYEIKRDLILITLGDPSPKVRGNTSNDGPDAAPSRNF